MNEKHPVIPGLVRKPQPRTAGGDIYPHLPAERGATPSCSAVPTFGEGPASRRNSRRFVSAWWGGREEQQMSEALV